MIRRMGPASVAYLWGTREFVAGASARYARSEIATQIGIVWERWPGCFILRLVLGRFAVFTGWLAR